MTNAKSLKVQGMVLLKSSGLNLPAFWLCVGVNINLRRPKAAHWHVYDAWMYCTEAVDLNV